MDWSALREELEATAALAAELLNPLLKRNRAVPLLVPDGSGGVSLGVAPDRQGVLWADGRRSFVLPHSARVEVCRHAEPVRFARLADAPFTDRLVAKFGLPVAGWRGGRAST